MDENLTAMLGMLFLFGFPVAAFVINRVLKHQERMEMLRRGFIPPPDRRDKRAYQAWQQSASAWSPGAAQQQWNPGTPPPPPRPMPPPGWTSPEDDPQRALYKGIRLAFIGLAITIGLSIALHRGPWILGGLIPMFVGIAQIIIALLSGAQLPGVQPQMTFMPPPPGTGPPPGAGPPPPGFGSSGGPWEQPKPARPHFEELTKPVPPPDVR